MSGTPPTALLTTLLIASGLLSACMEDEQNPELALALEQTVRAVGEEDWATLWRSSSRESQEELLTLHLKLHSALDVGQNTVVPGKLGSLKEALGSALIAGISPTDPDPGPKLLARLLSGETLDFDLHAMDGLRIESITSAEGLTTVNTLAGERFTFTREPEGWRSCLISDLLRERGIVKTYLQHAKAVREHAKAQNQAWASSTDPSRPQGAYNLAKRALETKPVDAKSLFAFLDDPARDVLIEAIERSRVVQRGVQRRIDPADRMKAYKKRGMWHHVRAGSDRQLYMYWAELPGFEAPFATRALATRVTMGAEGAQATVHTADGAQVPFVQAQDGTWKIADQARRLKKLLWEPMDRAFDHMARPPESRKYKTPPGETAPQ